MATRTGLENVKIVPRFPHFSASFRFSTPCKPAPWNSAEKCGNLRPSNCQILSDLIGRLNSGMGHPSHPQLARRSRQAKKGPDGPLRRLDGKAISSQSSPQCHDPVYFAVV